MLNHSNLKLKKYSNTKKNNNDIEISQGDKLIITKEGYNRYLWKNSHNSQEFTYISKYYESRMYLIYFKTINSDTVITWK